MCTRCDLTVAAAERVNSVKREKSRVDAEREMSVE